MIADIGKRLVFVLPANIHKRSPDALQHAERSAATVNANFVLPVGIELSQYDNFIVAVVKIIGNGFAHPVGNGKHTLDITRRFAEAQHSLVVSSADKHGNTVDYYRLAGAGFAAKNIKPLSEFELKARYKRKVFYSKLRKHKASVLLKCNLSQLL